MKKLLTPHDVAELLQVSVPTVQRWVREGTLPAVKIRRKLRFDPDQIDKAVKKLDAATA